jgi:uncharacterized cupredoxin-like copper-binding protein
MYQDRLVSMLESRLSRRVVMQRAAVAGAGAALALGGSQFALAGHQGAEGAEYPELVIVAKEMSFEVAETFEGGVVKLTFDNQGQMDHHAMFMRVNDEATLEDVQAALATPDFGAVFAVSTSYGGPMAGPGMKASVILDLPAGTYVLICAIPGDDGMPHYMMGMQAVLEVTTPAATTVLAPEADATVELMEMMFHGLAPEFAAGPVTLEVVNAGAAIHELALLQLAEGFTSDMFMEMVLAPPSATPEAAVAEQGPPPFAIIAGVAPMNPGFINFLPLELTAGEYVSICFIPDTETGAPHAALGMVMPFVVA